MPAWLQRHTRQHNPASAGKFLSYLKPLNDGNDATENINEEDKANLLEQAIKARQNANLRLRRAEESNDEGRINQARKGWVEACEIELKAERLFADQQRLRGQFLSRSELSGSILVMLGYLKQMKSKLSRRVALEIQRFLSAEQVQSVMTAIDGIQDGQNALLARLEAMSAPDQAAAWLELNT